MKTQVSILHNDYPRHLRDTIEEKLQGLSKFGSRLVSMKASIERQNEDHRVELVAHVGQGSVLVADVQGDTFKVVLDEALDRMTRQLKRHHEKLTVDRRHGGRQGH